MKLCTSTMTIGTAKARMTKIVPGVAATDQRLGISAASRARAAGRGEADGGPPPRARPRHWITYLANQAPTVSSSFERLAFHQGRSTLIGACTPVPSCLVTTSAEYLPVAVAFGLAGA